MTTQRHGITAAAAAAPPGAGIMAASIACAFGAAAVLVASQGNLIAGVAFLAAVVVIGVSWYRLDWGFNLFAATVLLCDQFTIPGFEPFTYKISYFLNLKENPYLPPLSAGVINPLELHLLLLFAVWFFVAAARGRVAIRRVPAAAAVILFFGSVGWSLWYGLSNGGEILPALWEVRALSYFGLVYFLVPQIYTTKPQIAGLLAVCIAAISFKAFQGISRFIRLGFTFYGLPTLTNHEDPVFFATLMVLVVALVLFGARCRQRTALLLLLLPLTVGFITAQRRAAYASTIAMSAAFVVLLPSRERRLLVTSSLPVLVLLGIYGFAGWDSEGKWAGPVRLFKSGLTTDKETSGERYYSNLYRDIEKYDLAQTVRKSPLGGRGFGNKYDMPIELVPIPFLLRDYIPHNQVLWLLVKMGAAGFFFFWLFVDTYLFEGAGLLLRLRDPYLRAVCAMAIVAILNQIVASYYDLQLTYYRNMVYLGILMGLLPALAAADGIAWGGRSSRRRRQGGAPPPPATPGVPGHQKEVPHEA